MSALRSAGNSSVGEATTTSVPVATMGFRESNPVIWKSASGCKSCAVAVRGRKQPTGRPRFNRKRPNPSRLNRTAPFNRVSTVPSGTTMSSWKRLSICGFLVIPAAAQIRSLSASVPCIRLVAILTYSRSGKLSR